MKKKTARILSKKKKIQLGFVGDWPCIKGSSFYADHRDWPPPPIFISKFISNLVEFFINFISIFFYSIPFFPRPFPIKSSTHPPIQVYTHCRAL